MRVLHIMAGAGNGGAELYSTDVMLGLHAAGLDQCVVMRKKSMRAPLLADAGLRVNTRVLDIPFRPWQRFQLRQLIAKEKPDIVHCWMRRAGSLMPGNTKTRAVIGWFGNYEDPKHFPHCHTFVGCTAAIRESTISQGVAPERAFYIPTFPSVREEPAQNRATYQTPEDARVLLTLSRLHPKKGLDLLMRAMADSPNCYLWMAGDGPMRAELEALARSLGIENRVRFLGWCTHRGALLKAADICVLPSNYEPFGTVILEAWASKTPLVACASAGPAAHIVNNENGLLVPIGDEAALRGALTRVLEDAPLRQHMIERGFADYTASFTPEAVVQKWVALYTQLLNAPPR